MFPIKWELISSTANMEGAASEQQPWQAASAGREPLQQQFTSPEIHCEEGRRVTSQPPSVTATKPPEGSSRKVKTRFLLQWHTSSSNTYYKAMRRTFVEEECSQQNGQERAVSPRAELRTLLHSAAACPHRPTKRDWLLHTLKIRQSLSLWITGD